MIETNPFWQKLTKPIRDQHINSLISDIKIDSIAPWDRNFTFAERLVPKMQLFSQFKNWVSSWFSGFDLLPEKYICNGNTDSLNHIFMQGKFQRVFILENEYSYYGHLCQELGIELIIFDRDSIDTITENDLVCISIPNAYNGNVDQRKDIVEYLQNKNCHLYIDVAYCGLTAPFHLKIQNKTNTYFAFTFSKTLAVGFNRISVLYAGRTIPGLAIMNKIG
jgi:histidinol-phosphate/aromatic aminotransferase/cobyric acid decarboxylase-like protein